MKDFEGAVQLPSRDDLIPPVTIFDARGHLVRVVAATEFRRTHGVLLAAGYPATAIRRPRRGKSQTS
jgi:hypothetical protein